MLKCLNVLCEIPHVATNCLIDRIQVRNMIIFLRNANLHIIYSVGGSKLSKCKERDNWVICHLIAKKKRSFIV